MIETRELKQPGIAHGFFGRQGGHSTGIFASLNCGLGSGDDRATVVRNRERGRQGPGRNASRRSSPRSGAQRGGHDREKAMAP